MKSGTVGIDGFNQLATRCFNRDATCPTGQIAIVLDGVVKSAPTIQTPTFERDQIQITGNFSEREAKDLALVLRSARCPCSSSRQAVQTVSATLGKDSLRAGLVAGLVGLLLVVLYMLLYYRRARPRRARRALACRARCSGRSSRTSASRSGLALTSPASPASSCRSASPSTPTSCTSSAEGRGPRRARPSARRSTAASAAPTARSSPPTRRRSSAPHPARTSHRRLGARLRLLPRPVDAARHDRRRTSSRGRWWSILGRSKALHRGADVLGVARGAAMATRSRRGGVAMTADRRRRTEPKPAHLAPALPRRDRLRLHRPLEALVRHLGRRHPRRPRCRCSRAASTSASTSRAARRGRSRRPDTSVERDPRARSSRSASSDAKIQTVRGADGERDPRPGRRRRPSVDARASVRADARRERPSVDVGEVEHHDVGPTWGDEITQQGAARADLFLVLVSLYLTFRFEWKMARRRARRGRPRHPHHVGVYSVVRVRGHAGDRDRVPHHPRLSRSTTPSSCSTRSTRTRNGCSATGPADVQRRWSTCR